MLIGFIIGLFIGGGFGVLIMAAAAMSGED